MSEQQETGSGEVEAQAPEPAEAVPAAEPVAPTLVEPEAPIQPGPTPTFAEPVASPVGGELPPEPPPAAATAPPADRPELAIAGAFGGGFVLAMILKRLAR